MGGRTDICKWKDYRIEERGRYDDDIGDRRVHPLLPHARSPQGRIRYYGVLANGSRAESLARARELLVVPPPRAEPEIPPANDSGETTYPCPCCGGHMLHGDAIARCVHCYPVAPARKDKAHVGGWRKRRPTHREPAARMRIGPSGQIRRVFIDDVRRAPVLEAGRFGSEAAFADSVRRQSESNDGGAKPTSSPRAAARAAPTRMRL